VHRIAATSAVSDGVAWARTGQCYRNRRGLARSCRQVRPRRTHSRVQ